MGPLTLARKVLRFFLDTLFSGPAVPLAVLAVIAGGGLVLQWFQPINHDVGWLLVVSGRLLDGVELYTSEVIETNPPLVIYLFSLPVALGRLLGLNEIPCFKAMFLALAAVSIATSWAALRESFAERPRGSALAGFVVLPFALVTLLLPWSLFGQREAFMLVFAMPYLLLLGLRARGAAVPRPLALVAGLGGGLAISMKPHYLVAAAIIELGLMVRRRSWWTLAREEVLVAVPVGLIYLASIVLFAPGYIETMLPLLRDAYWAFQKPMGKLLGPVDLAVLALGTLAVVAALAMRTVRDTAAMLWLAGIAFLLATFLQRTGWAYTRLPFAGCFIVLLSLAVFAAVEALAHWLDDGSEVPAPRLVPWLGSALSLALALHVVGGIGSVERGLRALSRPGSRNPAGYNAPRAQLIDEYAAGESVYFLTVAMVEAYPALNYSRARSASRFPSLWILPILIRAREGQPLPESLTPERLQELEKFLRDAVVEDLERGRPRAIFVDQRRRHQAYVAPNFQILDFFLEDERFARIFARYEYDPRPVQGNLAVATLAADR